MKVTGPLMSMNASGKIGGRLVFSQRASGQMARFQRAQKDVQTVARTTQRALYTSAVNGWLALSDNDRELWRLRALNMHMTGYNLYIKENIHSVSYDADAQAFFNATLLSATPKLDAINDFVIALKAASLWSKLKVIIPLVSDGINATRPFQSKFNLKDPRDLDAAFRLAVTGTPTFDDGGVTWDNTGSYANTFFNTLSQFGGFNGLMALYCTAHPNVSGEYDLANDNVVSANFSGIIPTYSTNNFYGCFGSASYVSVSNADGRGFYVASLVSLSNLKTYKNGSVVLTTTDAMVLENSNLYFGGCNHGGTANRFSSASHALLLLSDQTLSDGEVATLYTIVQAFQTALGRAV